MFFMKYKIPENELQLSRSKYRYFSFFCKTFHRIPDEHTFEKLVLLFIVIRSIPRKRVKDHDLLKLFGEHSDSDIHQNDSLGLDPGARADF